MKKNDFLKIEQGYFERRKYLENIKPGNLVWEVIGRGGWDVDYHPAVVKGVNVDEDYIDVIDVSEPNNPEKKYTSFVTESQLLKIAGFSKEGIEQERKEYEGIIKMVTQN